MKRPEADVNEALDAEFEATQSDLSNYENPYKKKFKPVQNAKSTDDLFETRYSTTFVGFEDDELSQLANKVFLLGTHVFKLYNATC